MSIEDNSMASSIEENVSHQKLFLTDVPSHDDSSPKRTPHNQVQTLKLPLAALMRNQYATTKN